MGSDGVRRANVERAHERALSTVVGEVRVDRLAYRARGQETLYVADGMLNLPEEKHSHGMRRLAAIEATRDSFEEGQEALFRHTGQRLGKRQLRELVVRAAVDFESFYEQRQRHRSRAGRRADPLLRRQRRGDASRGAGRRPESRPRAQKLKTRLSKGEKRGRKRMAEVAAV